MKYSKIQYNDLKAHASVSKFEVDGGVGEYNIIIEGTDAKEPLRKQVDNLLAAMERVMQVLPDDSAVVFKRYFLSDPTNQRDSLPADDKCAVSVIGQAPLNGTKVALWAYVQTAMHVHRSNGGLWCASHGHYRHLWCGGVSVPDLHSELATMVLFGDYEIKLDREGGNLLDNCMRTWFFVRDIDTNYRGVVVGRNDIFRNSGLSPLTHFIASTGIGGDNADVKATVTMDAYAVGGITPKQVKYLYASDFLNPTVEYGVAFERGTTIDYGDRRHVLISGTASINNKGEVMYPGDICRQTDRMIQNVEALINEGGCEMSDLTHIIVYLRDWADYAVVKDIFSQRFAQMPVVIVQAPVCRPGWLVEMECMAIKAIANPAFPPL